MAVISLVPSRPHRVPAASAWTAAGPPRLRGWCHHLLAIVLLAGALSAGGAFAQPAPANIIGWQVEAPPVRGATASPATDAPAERQLRVMLDRAYPVMARLTWVEVDGKRLGPARESADLRSLSVPLPASVQVSPASQVRLAEPAVQARQAGSAGGWTPPPARVTATDPADRGPLQVDAFDYALGDQAFAFPLAGNRIARGEMRARVYLPQDLGGPMPVVLFLHGRHQTCHSSDGPGLAWPCPADSEVVNSYLGYDGPAHALATQGYVVVSVSVNGINAFDNGAEDYGRSARAALLRRHLDYLQRANATATAELGQRLRGRLDMERIGVMGHSRGGEGAVAAAVDAAAGVGPHRLKAVFALAPTSFADDARVPQAALAVMLPYCDGDVSDLQGQRYVDASRHAGVGNVPQATLIAHGANHNFYNAVWTPGTGPGASDDALYFDRSGLCRQASPYRLPAPAQYRAGAAYIAAFFRLHLGDEHQLAPLFDGSATRPPGEAVVQSVASAPPLDRLDLASFQRDTAGISHLGWNALYCDGRAYQPGPTQAYCADESWEGTVPHWTGLGTGQMLRLSWSGGRGQSRILLPGGVTDVSGYGMLSLRAMPSERRHGLAAPALTVALVDRQGRRAKARIPKGGDALGPLPGGSPAQVNWLLRSVQIPLKAFNGVNLSEIVAVELTPATGAGEVFLSDLALVGTGNP
ncbi:hypothetical protein [Stenotrophomonas rhizophila]|uniref:poly(ethylene terephthalate) hydrolase family protein n=1 Tax=Stenotrophomonas rhizophila TaxID=216778 RepID=UPI001E4115D8|nr:hypothetical protein [Stenotrophomonas rhizophila]MCC7635845.1 hypothetical protein [Stenotrophomonas rhizophila]MCC7662669.1 hypothetical protein [Stenotrophomonas rhizophila]